MSTPPLLFAAGVVILGLAGGAAGAVVGGLLGSAFPKWTLQFER